MKLILKIFLLPLLIINYIACGGSSSSNNTASIRILAPTENSNFQAGDIISFSIATENFNLAPPFDRRTFKNHPGDENATEHTDDHSNTGETNPLANEGHYHVYLNDAEGSDPHLTSWSHEDNYQIPEDLEPGTHSLRFELRDNNHVIVGAETILFFDVIGFLP